MIYIFAEKRELAGFNWRLFARTWVRLHGGWLATALGFCLLTYYGRALRWAAIMRPVKADTSLWGLTSATVIGFAALAIFGRPGEFVRPYLIAVRERVPLSSQVAAWLLERIFDLLTALLIFGVALSQVRASAARVGPALTWVLSMGGWVAGITSAISLAILILFRHFTGPVRRRLLESLGFLREHHYRKAERLVTAFAQGMEATRSQRGLILIAGYTALEWMLIAGCFYSTARAFGSALPSNALDMLIIMGFVTFGAAVQVPGIGGGVQVMAVLVLTELYGVPLEIAGSAALLLWFITFVVVIPLGLALAVHEGLSWSRLRHIEQEASW